VFSALTFAATPLANATQKTLPAFASRPKMLIKKAYHLAIVAPVSVNFDIKLLKSCELSC